MPGRYGGSSHVPGRYGGSSDGCGYGGSSDGCGGCDEADRYHGREQPGSFHLISLSFVGMVLTWDDQHRTRACQRTRQISVHERLDCVVAGSWRLGLQGVEPCPHPAPVTCRFRDAVLPAVYPDLALSIVIGPVRVPRIFPGPTTSGLRMTSSRLILCGPVRRSRIRASRGSRALPAGRSKRREPSLICPMRVCGHALSLTGGASRLLAFDHHGAGPYSAGKGVPMVAEMDFRLLGERSGAAKYRVLTACFTWARLCLDPLTTGLRFSRMSACRLTSTDE